MTLWHLTASSLMGPMQHLNASLHLLAQAATSPSSPVSPATMGTEDPPWYARPETMRWLPIFAMVGIFYLVMFRSKKKQDNKRKTMMDTLKRGDKVVTIGGIMGTVVEAREADVVLKVDESTNTKLKFRRDAIKYVVEEDASAPKSEK